MPDRDLESADNRRQIKPFPKRQRFAINNHAISLEKNGSCILIDINHSKNPLLCAFIINHRLIQRFFYATRISQITLKYFSVAVCIETNSFPAKSVKPCHWNNSKFRILI